MQSVSLDPYDVFHSMLADDDGFQNHAAVEQDVQNPTPGSGSA